MTNKFDNWSRLLRVIERFGKSINGFAMQIGLPRAENLYHIRKGNYGISEDLADRIIKQDPAIDRTWLLSGVGNMLKNETLEQEKLPFYIDEVEEILPGIGCIEPSGYLELPYKTNCDIVIRSFSRPMSDTISAAQDLFLKRTDIDGVVQGNEYVLMLNRPTDNVIWRRVRWVAGNTNQWRLVARNREEFHDIFIDKSEVMQAWRVIARLTVLES
ncbi:MAG: hypothetical protein IKJ08_03730 [Alistipes sp.]|nr:hypothetical protein [Alistipes sp.]